MHSADTSARRARWLLAAGMLTALIATWSSWEEVRLLRAIAGGANVSDAVLEANDSRQALIAMTELGVGVVVAIAFLMWTRATTKRLIELGVDDMRYAPKWSVWGFVIPILNLFRPHQVIGELWKASEIAPGPDDPWRARATPLIVHVWWAALLVEGIVGRVLVQSGRQMDTIDEVLRFATMAMVASALGVVSAALAFQLVSVIDARRRASEARLASFVSISAAAPPA